MRRLLLLLLTFLLPLQLLAATVGDLPPHIAGDTVDATLRCAHGQAPAGGAALKTQLQAVDLVTLSAHANADADATGQNGDEDEADIPAAQAELEDHTIPARIATPDIPWQPFPHAFAAPLNWPSFVRDQLRPPPLA